MGPSLPAPHYTRYIPCLSTTTPIFTNETCDSSTRNSLDWSNHTDLVQLPLLNVHNSDFFIIHPLSPGLYIGCRHSFTTPTWYPSLHPYPICNLVLLRKVPDYRDLSCKPENKPPYFIFESRRHTSNPMSSNPFHWFSLSIKGLGRYNVRNRYVIE